MTDATFVAMLAIVAWLATVSLRYVHLNKAILTENRSLVDSSIALRDELARSERTVSELNIRLTGARAKSSMLESKIQLRDKAYQRYVDEYHDIVMGIRR